MCGAISVCKCTLARKWFIFNNWFALTFNAFAVRGCCVVGPCLDVSSGSSCIGYI